MRIENRKLEGDVKINDEVTLNGTVGGSIIVSDSGNLVLNGIVCQDLILEKGSIVELFGTVNGDVRNRGGEIRVKGTIMGSIYKEAGTIIIEPEGKIKGHIY